MKNTLNVSFFLILTLIGASACNSPCDGIRLQVLPRLEKAIAGSASAADENRSYTERKRAWIGVVDQALALQQVRLDIYKYAAGLGEKVPPFYDYTSNSTAERAISLQGGCNEHEFRNKRLVDGSCWLGIFCNQVYEYDAYCTRVMRPETMPYFNKAIALADSLHKSVRGQWTSLGPYSDHFLDEAMQSKDYEGYKIKFEESLELAKEAERKVCRN